MYNVINLPQQINISTDGTDENNYLYTANGQKLMKQTRTDFAVEQTVDYIGNFVYEDGTLKYILTDEGRVIVNTKRTYEYQYSLKDHLGNTRITFNQNGEIIQEDAYYPFGMKMNGLCYETGTDYKNKYLYNGKEMQDDFGLDWYDYGARFYDPQIGRWHSVDPLSEVSRRWSPNSYCYNYPMRFIDPDGMFVDDYFDKLTGKSLGTDGAKTNNIRLIDTKTYEKFKDSENKQFELQKEGNSELLSEYRASGKVVSKVVGEGIANHYLDELQASGEFPKNIDINVKELKTENANIDFDAKSNKYVITMNDSSFGHPFQNASDIKNELVHEFKGHGPDVFNQTTKGAKVQEYTSQKKAISAQINHSSFKSTSRAFKNELLFNYGPSSPGAYGNILTKEQLLKLK